MKTSQVHKAALIIVGIMVIIMVYTVDQFIKQGRF